MKTIFQNMLRGITILYALLLCVNLASASTETATVGALTYTLDTDACTATVTSFDGSVSELTIPSTIIHQEQSYTVTALGTSSFSGQTALTYISIPSTVAQVNNLSFYGCTSLTSVRFEDGDDIICLGLNNDTFSTSSAVNLKIGLFYDCPLETLYLGRSINYKDSRYSSSISYGHTYFLSKPQNFGYSAFYNQAALGSVTIGPKVTYLPDYLFYKSSALTCLAMDGVKEIGSYAFCDNTQLTSIAFGDSLTTIGSHAFYGATQLTSIAFGDSLTTIGSHAFYGATQLTTLSLPDALKKIGDYAFYGCTGITSMNIGDSLKSVGSYAFCGCSAFTAIAFPKGVTTLGKNAFDGCTQLARVSLGDSLTAIASSTFKECVALTEINMPNSVTSIGDSAFYNCSALATITLSSTLESIGKVVFWNNSALTSMSIPGTVESMGQNSFYGCTGITSLTFEDGEGELTITNNAGKSAQASYYKSNTASENYDYFCDLPLVELYLGKNLAYQYVTRTASEYSSEYKGNYHSAPFANKTTLESVTIGPKVTTLYHMLLDGCTGLRTFTVGEGVERINSYVFCGCTGFTTMTIPDNVLGIGAHAFENCTNLSSIDLGNGVETVGAYCFNNCTSLSSLVFPGSLTSQGNFSVKGCTSLTSVRYDDGEATLKIGSNGYTTSTTSTTYNTYSLYVDCPLTDLYIGRNLSYTATAGYGYSPFYQKRTLQNVIFSAASTITAIGDNLLRGCSQVKELTLPTSLVTIGGSAFQDCSAIERVSMSATVTSLGENCFDGDSSIVHIKSYNDVPPEGLPGFEQTVKENAILYVTEESLDAYEASPTWEDFLYIRKLSEEDLVVYIMLNMDSAEIKEGEVVQLSASVSPENATNKSVVWKSEDETIATVDADGFVAAVGIGETNIMVTAAYSGSAKATCHITVNPIVKSVSISDDAITLYEGDTATLTATVYPDDAVDTAVTWSSSDETVATVSSDGVVVAVGVGEATVTVTSVDNAECQATCIVTVAEVLRGDANDNGVVNVNDAVVITRYVLGRSVTSFRATAADVNADGEVTTADASGVIAIVLEDFTDVSSAKANYLASAKQNVYGSNDNVEECLNISDISMCSDESMTISMPYNTEYVALQADIYMPEGVTIENISLGDAASESHKLFTRKVGEDIMRVVVFSAKNEVISSNAGSVLNLSLSANTSAGGYVDVRNIVAADATGSEYSLTAMGGYISTTTSIGSATMNDGGIKIKEGAIHFDNINLQTLKVYTASGILVGSWNERTIDIHLPAGVYVVYVGVETIKTVVK